MVVCVTACGVSEERVRVSSRTTIAAGPEADHAPAQTAITAPAAHVEAAQALRARDRWNRAAWFARAAENAETAASPDPQPARVASVPSAGAAVSAPSTSSINWDCVAVAETGGDFSMHGSSYSSAYGVMNQAVRENAPPDVAARILAGTASKAEQLAMAQRIAARFGFSAWAPSTVAKCNA